MCCNPINQDDFLSVALVDGFVEFRYDLGSGAVSIRSPERIRPGHWHRLVAARYGIINPVLRTNETTD